MRLKIFLVTLFLASTASAQSMYDLERRVQQLESTVYNLDYRLRNLEQGQINPPAPTNPTAFYCIAQCRGNSSTAAGGRGRSEAEAKQAAFEAVRKTWACHMEITDCSPEYSR